MFSQTAEYALRAMVAIAGNPDVLRTGRTIAEESRVPLDYLVKVLNTLVRAGLVHAQRGRRGGFTLAMPGDNISVLDVVNAVDPIRRIRTCPLGLEQHAENLCPLHRKLDYALSLMENAFRETTIASLCGEPSKEAGKALTDNRRDASKAPELTRRAAAGLARSSLPWPGH